MGLLDSTANFPTTPIRSGLDELRIAYASAMWAWASVESDWYMVFIAATDSFQSHFVGLRDSYFSIVSAKSRLDITHSAAKARWRNCPEMAAWADLHRKCENELRTRGRIAHLTGYTVKPQHPHQKEIAIIGEHFFHPNHPVSYQEAKNKGFTAAQLFELSAKWDQLHSSILQFCNPIWLRRLEELSRLPAD